MDDSNKLVTVSGTYNKTTYGGIAARRDVGGFLAVQERRISVSTGERASALVLCSQILQINCLSMQRTVMINGT